MGYMKQMESDEDRAAREEREERLRALAAFAASRMKRAETTFDKATTRVANDEDLAPYTDILIEYDWHESGHLSWVATADKGEILDWCRRVRRDEDQREEDEHIYQMEVGKGL